MDEPMMRRGLGRGLATILGQEGDRLPDGVAGLRAGLVEAALTTVSSRRRLALCGHVFDPNGVEPTVTLRSPTIGQLHPTTAYRLYTQLYVSAARGPGFQTIELDELRTVIVMGEDTPPNGFFFGIPVEADDSGLADLAMFCSVFTSAIADIDRGITPTEAPRIVMDQTRSTAHAEVTLSGETGFGSGSRPTTAVANAAMSAVGDGCKLLDLRQLRAGPDAATLATVSGGRGKLALAAAADEDPLVGAAVACVRGVARLLAR